ncbi:MAG: hypothetical protein WCX81_07385, partial [Monoglobales bacterium]
NMKITVWDIFKYINKWMSGIVAIVIMTVLVTGYYVNSNQTYIAETIIRYTDQNAKSGLTPDGKTLDVYEIIAPNIIEGALKDLNIKESVERIRSRIIITPIIPNEIVELKKSKNKEGEEYDYFPIDYSIKYSAGGDKNGAYARDILEAVIDNYGTYYSETYLNNAVIPEIDYDSDINNHDYLEVAEVINTSAADIIEYLEGLHASNPDFRSPATGMSMNDLATRYKTIKNHDLPALFSNIFNAQITKDKDTLIKKYKYRQEQYILTNQHKTKSAELALNVMEKFVDRNEAVKNSLAKDDDQGIRTQDIFVHEKSSRTQTTYDDLMDSYVSDGVGAATALIESDYCQAVIETFSKPADESIDYEAAKAEAEEIIQYIREKMSNLYRLTRLTINDYNSLNVSSHIESLTGTVLSTGLSLRFYLLISLIIGILFGMLFAVAFEIISRLRREVLK